MQSTQRTSSDGAAGLVCPLAPVAKATPLTPSDELLLPLRRRLDTCYAEDQDQNLCFHLYYGEKEVVFDEPELFPFAEELVQAQRFTGEQAMAWGPGYGWERIRGLLEALVSEGVLRRASAETPAIPKGPVQTSLPPGPAQAARTWLECESLTESLMGRSVEIQYLEALIPVYRIVHPWLDAEGRQVGEANVFPPQLRLDVPTEWRVCQYPGSRYLDACPMNVTALKSMTRYWKPMLVLLQRLRAEYVRRFPASRAGLTLADVERLCHVVLALPTYLCLRAEPRVENGALHPVFSSLFRVTDGLRMTAHFMLVRAGEGGERLPDSPTTFQEIHEYAERNAAFLSPHGVCAGPRNMVEEFLRVMLDGESPSTLEQFELEPEVAQGLAELESVFDYAMLGLQSYALSQSLWPLGGRAAERLLPLVEAAAADARGEVAGLARCLRERIAFLRQETLLGRAEERASYERLYAHMLEHTSLALHRENPAASARSSDPELQARLSASFERVLASRGCSSSVVAALAHALSDYVLEEQALTRAATRVQAQIAVLLGRAAPARALSSADMAAQRHFYETPEPFPYLAEELERELQIEIHIEADTVSVRDAR